MIYDFSLSTSPSICASRPGHVCPSFPFLIHGSLFSFSFCLPLSRTSHFAKIRTAATDVFLLLPVLGDSNETELLCACLLASPASDQRGGSIVSHLVVRLLRFSFRIGLDEELVYSGDRRVQALVHFSDGLQLFFAGLVEQHLQLAADAVKVLRRGLLLL